MSSPRVAFDVTPLLSGGTGIARYVTQLGSSLEERGVVVRRYGIGRAQHRVPEGTRRLRVPLRVVERSWTLGGPPRIEQLTGPVDIVHSTNLVVPRSHHPIVVTVYDTAPLDHPGLHPPRTDRRFRTMMDALSRAAAIVTVSKAVATDLERHGVAPELLDTIYLGRTQLPPPRPMPIDLPFLLTVGAQVPRKDQATLVRAFAEADLGEVLLALAGPEGEETAHLRAIASELGVIDRVLFLGAVDDGQLAWLYRAALAFCFPSVGEGFVTPIVEAMAAGLPVIASDIPPTVEIAGGVALLHAVGDVAGCRTHLEDVVQEPGRRERLAQAGRERAERFTWDRTAVETEALYERVLGR